MVLPELKTRVSNNGNLPRWVEKNIWMAFLKCQVFPTLGSTQPSAPSVFCVLFFGVRGSNSFNCSNKSKVSSIFKR